MYNCMRLEKFMKRNWVKLVMLAMLLGLRPAEAGTIDTSAGWDEHTSIRWFAVPNTTTYGQTFFALDGRIDDFSFRLKGALPTTDIKMKAFIYQWAGPLVAGEGGRPIGSPLFMTPLEFKPGDNGWHEILRGCQQIRIAGDDRARVLEVERRAVIAAGGWEIADRRAERRRHAPERQQVVVEMSDPTIAEW